MKKKTGLSLLLCLALTVSLAACGAPDEAPAPTAAPTAASATSATEPTFSPEPAPEETAAPIVSVRQESEYIYSEDGNTLLLSYACAEPSVSMSGNAAASGAINEALHAQYEAFVLGQAAQDEYSVSGREGFLQDAKENYEWCRSEGYPDNFIPYELRREVSVRRANGSVLSITYDDTSYLGGAHGYVARSGRTFDLRTGEELTLANLTDDYETFLSTAVEYLRDISHTGEYTAYGMYDGYEDQLADLFRACNWYFDNEGLVLMANPYELASYAAGRIEFTLPYAWLAYQIRAEYLPAESEADGTLTGEMRDTAGDVTYLYDDGTDGAGACVTFTASGTVENVALCTVTYLDYSNSCRIDGTLWYAGRLSDGESVCVQTWIPDAMPNLSISWRDGEGEHTKLISQSGEDGSLVLMRNEEYVECPVNISGKSAYHYDIDGDGFVEEIAVTAKEKDGVCEYTITVDGTALDRTYMPFGERYDLWICQMRGDGVCELFFSADMGSDDYESCGWHGDTLEPILFTGDARYGADAAALTGRLDGCIVFGGGVPVVEDWYYQLGTYRASIGLTFASDGTMTLAPYMKWEYSGNNVSLTVAKILPVYLDESGTAVLVPGEKLTLTGTNGKTTFFRTEDGRTGYITPEYAVGTWTINGENEESFFEMLPYVG